MAKRVVLAYSGGLDTSVAVRWMIEELDVEVIAVAGDVGQGGDWEAVKDRAMPPGRSRPSWSTAARSSPDDFVAPALKANAMYEDQYPLVSAAVAPGDRQAPGGGGPQLRRRRRGPRLHGQGQRPGALRGRHPALAPTSRSSRRCASGA